MALTLTEWLWKSVIMISLLPLTAAKCGPGPKKYYYSANFIILFAPPTKKFRFLESSVSVHSIKPTCKLRVTVATTTELRDQLAVGLKDEDATRLVVDNNDVSVSVHGHAFRTQQLSQTDLVLQTLRSFKHFCSTAVLRSTNTTSTTKTQKGWTYLKLAFTWKDADPLVVIVRDDDVTVGVDSDARRSLHLTRRPAPDPKTTSELTTVRKCLQSVIYLFFKNGTVQIF